MKKNMWLLLLLTIALLAATYLVGQNQETRKEAYFADAQLLLLPTNLVGNVGDNVPVQLWVNTVGKIDFVQARICYDNKLKFDLAQASSLVTLNSEHFNAVELTAVSTDQSGYAECLDLAVSSNKAVTSLATGAKRVATISFKVQAEGTGSMALIPGKSQVSGSNPNVSSNDMSLSVQAANQVNYTFGVGTGDTGPGAVVHFKMSYLGLLPNAKCAVNWPLQVVALGNGVTKTFSSIVATNRQVVNNKVVFEFSKVLSGFSQYSNVALFLKGPKHLQVKYGVQNQTKMYNKAGGELTLMSSGASAGSTNTLYDFSGYPLLAGDLNQDGVINGIDFSLLKAEALVHRQVASGANLDGDLDGDCMATNNDVQIFKTSLQEKQGQLY